MKFFIEEQFNGSLMDVSWMQNIFLCKPISFEELPQRDNSKCTHQINISYIAIQLVIKLNKFEDNISSQTTWEIIRIRNTNYNLRT